MPRVRFRVACRGRVELHEVEGDAIDIGRDERADLVVHHATVAPRHARVLLRRGRLILTDLGRAKTGTTRGRERLLAPVTLVEGEPFGLGDVTLAAWAVAGEGDETLAGRALPAAHVGAELESFDPGVRRYRAELADGRRAELVVARPAVAEEAAAQWSAGAERSSPGRPPHVAPLAWRGRVDAREALIEPLPDGLRLSTLLDGVARGAVRLPIEATIVLLAHLAESVAAMAGLWGVHGSIDPRAVHLGTDGSITLLRPGPLAGRSETVLDDFLAPERRFGSAPTVASDAYALGVLGKAICCSRKDCPVRIRALSYWLAHAEPGRRPEDLAAIARELRDAAQTAGLDPTYAHVARAVRLLAPNLARRLCSVPASSGSRPTDFSV